ncbi:hypothetical protein DEO72_LG10g3733 [Vigna unguiculata]|uniref:Uncharacterized protein n=1 Tax=Vigna unguiculata TaxID=3917 RepID=A0A4D6NGK5_VIGUN|nr:hypothetical protein DEO72_LG10g3733 [Vigna unguiculata]
MNSSGRMARGNPAPEFNPIHEIQFEEVLGRADGYPNPIGQFHVQTQSQNAPPTEEQGLPNFPPNYSYEIGESSSSRNAARVESPIDLNTQQVNFIFSLLHFFYSFKIFRNSAYDPSFEMRGLPLDPHLRLFFFNNHPDQPVVCNNMNTLYDPSFEERGLPLDPHLRCFALELAKKNAENGDKTDLK